MACSHHSSAYAAEAVATSDSRQLRHNIPTTPEDPSHPYSRSRIFFRYAQWTARATYWRHQHITERPTLPTRGGVTSTTVPHRWWTATREPPVNTHSCSPARCIPSSAAGRLLRALLHPELSRPAPLDGRTGIEASLPLPAHAPCQPCRRLQGDAREMLRNRRHVQAPPQGQHRVHLMAST